MPGFYPIVLFDGVCNLCSRSVQFILKRDRRGIFRFASLQSSLGQSLLQQSGLPTDGLDSFVLIDNGKIYTRSSGALRVLKRLGGLLSLLYGLWIVPRPVRDKLYDWVARNRYRWFGKEDSCWLPRPEWKERFLD
ncbi:MAG: thiol-disulfide oxidoreductase DCC family protein [Sphingobacteriales bacterium]|nr:thiol-disulfide oxidoreductase DCC family protein [Sphingobacteriales bacterium]